MASTSPLLPYQNGRVLVPELGEVSLQDGRFVQQEPQFYLVRLFVKRSQYSGVSSGSKLVPIPSQLDGQMLPGASGDSFYYRGYALDYAVVTPDWNLETSDESGLSFTQVTAQLSFLATGTECQLRFGQDPILTSRIQRSSGVFGGQGIDEIIYSEIGGVEIQLTGAELQN